MYCFSSCYEEQPHFGHRDKLTFIHFATELHILTLIWYNSPLHLRKSHVILQQIIDAKQLKQLNSKCHDVVVRARHYTAASSCILTIRLKARSLGGTHCLDSHVLYAYDVRLAQRRFNYDDDVMCHQPLQERSPMSFSKHPKQVPNR